MNSDLNMAAAFGGASKASCMPPFTPHVDEFIVAFARDLESIPEDRMRIQLNRQNAMLTLLVDLFKRGARRDHLLEHLSDNERFAQAGVSGIDAFLLKAQRRATRELNRRDLKRKFHEQSAPPAACAAPNSPKDSEGGCSSVAAANEPRHVEFLPSPDASNVNVAGNLATAVNVEQLDDPTSVESVKTDREPPL